LARKDVYEDLIEDLERNLGLWYPQGAPWKVQQTMPGPKGNVPAIYAQVVTSDKRQAFHWDASALWYKMEDGRVWAPLSIVVHLCDGPATILGPAQSYFPAGTQILQNPGSTSFGRHYDPSVERGRGAF
jgi:hypothetical protein